MNKENYIKFNISKSAKEKLERNKASKTEVKEQTKKVLTKRLNAIKSLARK